MGTNNNPGEARCRCGDREQYHCHSEGGSRHRIKAANGENGCTLIHEHFFQGDPTPPDGPPPIQMLLWCPGCMNRHIDTREFLTRPHHTHACQNCGLTWRPAIEPTVGVRFLPGFKNEQDGELQSARSRPEDATGNPSSSQLPYDGSTSAGDGPQGEPVTADTEGQPRQDEASLPLSTTKTRYDSQKRSGCRTPNSMYRSVISDRTVAIRVLLPFAPKLTKDEAVALETRLECAVENVLAGLFEPIGDAIAELEAHLRDERREWEKSREHFNFVIGKKLQQIEELERKIMRRDEEIAKLRTPLRTIAELAQYGNDLAALNNLAAIREKEQS